MGREPCAPVSLAKFNFNSRSALQRGFSSPCPSLRGAPGFVVPRFFCSPRQTFSSILVFGLDFPKLPHGIHWESPPDHSIHPQWEYITINPIYILYFSAFLQQLEALLELEMAAVGLAAVFCRFYRVYRHRPPSPTAPPPQQWGFVVFFSAALAEGSVCRTAAGKAAAGLRGGNGFAVFSPFEERFWGAGGRWRGHTHTLFTKRSQELPKTQQQWWDLCDFHVFGIEQGSAGWTQPPSAPGRGCLHPPASQKKLKPSQFLPFAPS